MREHAIRLLVGHFLMKGDAIMARKTFDVAEFVAYGNNFLQFYSKQLQPEARYTKIAAMEHVLFASDRYSGFRFLDPNGDESLREYFIN